MWNLLKVTGSFLIAIVALFGDWLKNLISPVKLTIIDNTIKGHKTCYQDHTSVYFFNGLVKNCHKYRQATNVMVILSRISTEVESNKFKIDTLPADAYFKWTPSGMLPLNINITTNNKFDLGYIDKKTTALYQIYTNFIIT
ncbi:MAG: hypothetical protein Kapaf2KO_19400 [Candidatus Kapaibacteriales bacterium]